MWRSPNRDCGAIARGHKLVSATTIRDVAVIMRLLPESRQRVGLKGVRRNARYTIRDRVYFRTADHTASTNRLALNHARR